MISLIPLQIPKNLVRVKDPNIMATIIKDAAKLPDLRYQINPKCFEPGFEYEWDRVLRMRAEKHPLIKGGKQS